MYNDCVCSHPPLLSMMVATHTKYGNLRSVASSFIPTLKRAAVSTGVGTTGCDEMVET